MHSRMIPLVAGLFAIAASPVFAPHPVFAQGNPSADQIIKSLTPTGDVSRQGTRGIRLSQPGDTAPAPSAVAPSSGAPARSIGHPTMAAAKPSAAAPAASATSATAPAVDLTVNFETGSADLTADAMKTLDALGTALSSDALAHYRFRVEGHTDTVGSPGSNQALSQRRAKAVVNYIAAKFNIPVDRLVPVGMGEQDLAVKTAAQVPEPKNRRVVVVNLGA
jgi:OmpA-OmpF porin, OOP family